MLLWGSALPAAKIAGQEMDLAPFLADRVAAAVSRRVVRPDVLEVGRTFHLSSCDKFGSPWAAGWVSWRLMCGGIWGPCVGCVG